MAQPLKFLIHKLIIFSAISIVLWLVIFRWGALKYQNELCYSANHDYYITRHQTLWEKFWPDYRDYGTAKLFNRDGELLYENKAYFSSEFGPNWDAVGNGVFFQGVMNDWNYALPSSPGGDVRDLGICYP